MNKRQITKNFSRYATLYDDYADVQRRSAHDLAREFNIPSPRSILEIGSGTGLYTQCLRERFPDANIVAFDISEPMVQRAQLKYADNKTCFAVADADHLPTNRSFDLITSAACFQWLGNFESILETCRQHLETNGHLIFSIFGPKTFHELNESLQAIDSTTRVEAIHFPTLPEIHHLLLPRFSAVHIIERSYIQTFPDVKSLLTTIKYCGVRGRGSTLGPQQIRRLDKKYREIFGEIRATSQVFLCKGQKT